MSLALPRRLPSQGAHLAALIVLLASSLLAMALPRSASAAPAGRPDFKMPFTCGERWRLQTYRGHNPDDKKLDMYRVGGSTAGSAARASAAGRVHQWFAPGGLEIDHGGGWFTVYLHMSARVPVGTRVAEGQWIGTVGSVETRVAHLHYEQLYDFNHDGDGETNEMVHPVIQGTEYRLSPSGPFPTVTSTNGCSAVGKVWVDTFANAPGSSTPGGPQTGTLYAGTNYVYCKVWGPKVQHGDDYNHWWLLTDLDTGNPWRNQYVSAYYLSRWGNDVAKDNSGAVIRDC